MDNKGKLPDSDLDYYAYMNDSELEDCVDLELDNYEATDDLNENSVSYERPSKINNVDNIWNEVAQDPLQFIFKDTQFENLRLHRVNIDMLVDLFLEEFLSLVVEQTNCTPFKKLKNMGNYEDQSGYQGGKKPIFQKQTFFRDFCYI